MFSQVLQAGKRHSGGDRLVDLGSTTPPASSPRPALPLSLHRAAAAVLLISYASSSLSRRLTHASQARSFARRGFRLCEASYARLCCFDYVNVSVVRNTG